MSTVREALEVQLNSFDSATRRSALDQLVRQAESGLITFPPMGASFNLHCHTFFSYNGYGYSPSALAWRGRCAGLYAMGVVDFDVLDAIDEFLDACQRLKMRGCAGFETRVFVPQFSTRVINSPGEPGISYHMGVGFVSSRVKNKAPLDDFKATASARTHDLAARVGAFLDPVVLDFDRDVLPLTPNGNATERHVCMALDEKAKQFFADTNSRSAFWAARLGESHEKIAALLNDAPTFQGMIRTKTMKSGGAGYVRPDGKDFPRVEEVNAFVLENGAIPAYAYVDGTSEGESSMNELLDVMMESGVAAVNIIPDRNWNFKDPEIRRRKGQLLHEFVAQAQSRDLPIVAGTEMNAYGQKFVDDFDAPELAPLVPAFLEGAHIVYAHTRLQANAGMGYLSDWSKKNFTSIREKNRFFANLGERLKPGSLEAVEGYAPALTPQEILSAT